MEHPQQIEKALNDIAFIDDQLRQRRQAIRKIELDVTLDIAGARGEDGKLICTNEKQREGAIAKMLEESSDYRELGKGVGELERDRAALMARLERLRLEVRLEILEAEQRNHLAALKVADSIYFARTTNGTFRPARMEPPDIEMPF